MTVEQMDPQSLTPGDQPNKQVGLSRSLGQLLNAGKFVELCEIHAPVPEKRELFFCDAERLKPFFDAMVVTGQIKARAVLPSCEAAGLLRKKQIESIAVLSGQACNEEILADELVDLGHRGIRNVVCVSGDPIPDRAKYLDGLEMIRIVSSQSKTGDCLWLGGVIDPFLQPTSHAVVCLSEKIEAGADFVLTQMIFDLSGFTVFCDAMCVAGLDKKTAVIAGIPIVVSEQGLALAKRLPGVYLPGSVKEQLLNASDISVCGIAMAQQMIRQVRQISGIRGVCLMLLGGQDYQPLIDVIYHPV